MLSCCPSQHIKTVVEQDKSMTMFSLSQRVPTDPLQVTVEQTSLEAAAEVRRQGSNDIYEKYSNPLLADQ